MSAAPPDTLQPQVSILIKALNEERHIAACLDAVMQAIQGLQAEVVLVDSLSTDRTVEIARQYPVRIVQFKHVEDRSCGAAVQLGYQFARGTSIYVLDADMQLAPDFLPLALARLAADPGLAGVGGRLLDVRVRTEYDRRRARLAAGQHADVEVDELGGGGLYRRAAIEQAGYLANRWLAAFEEADLGARLRAAGWRLQRLQAVAVHHEGHAESNLGMLRRLWRNGRAQATGVFLRAAWRRPWWRWAARKQRHLLLLASMYGLAGFAAGAALAVSGSALAAAAVLVAPALALLAGLAVRKRSLRDAAWAWLGWHFFAAAAWRGALAAPRDPLTPIAACIVSRSPLD